MRIVAIAGSRIPSDTANSIQVMKACQALVQLGHELTLIVPANPSSIQHPPIDEIASLYGLQTSFNIEWLSSFNRRLFTWQAVQRARALKPGLRERDAADLIHALMSPEVYRLLVGDRRWKPERYQEWLATTLAQQLT